MGEQYTQLDKDNYRFLERFLDVTRSNLFFAKGVILVEGWSEEILLPIIAKKIGIDLTEKGIALINVAGKAFLHYAKIFQRKENPWMNIPVAVVIDIDIKPNDENKSACAQKTTAIEEEYNKQKVKIFISPHWTLEWCLWSSFSLKDKFEEVVKSVHPKTDFSEGFDAQLKTMLEKKTLKKTEVAYRLAKVIEDDQFATIAKMDENIKYLMDAIKYAASQD
jgi:putative ATP-dependent endonuclease of OLD family